MAGKKTWNCDISESVRTKFRFVAYLPTNKFQELVTSVQSLN
jgi:hypothetical protein